MTISVVRVGFTGLASEEYDGCEGPLGELLQRLEAEGRHVVSVSVLRSTRGAERHEAYIVFRGADNPPQAS
ncbi:MAG: hypothetical protein Q8L86_03060 [Vicinamibacterales bacterium]|nr:hypothetical protein [Vicinamibacterales bacterium]